MTSSSHPKILLVGCGKMGGAMLEGWLSSDLKPDVTIIDPDLHRHPGAKTVHSAAELAAGYQPDIIALAIKPQVAKTVLGDLARKIGPERLSKAALYSIMAGVSIGSMEKLLQEAGIRQTIAVIRVMPNLAASIKQSASGIYISPKATSQQAELGRKMTAAVGSVTEVPEEKDLAAVTGIAGSGPAYVFLLAEELARAGEALGLSDEAANKLARSMIRGAGNVLAQSTLSSEQLRKNVTSPGGTTAAALDVLMAPDAWPKTIPKAVEAAVRRSAGLDE